MGERGIQWLSSQKKVGRVDGCRKGRSRILFTGEKRVDKNLEGEGEEI